MQETKAAISERGFRQFAAFFGREPFPDEKLDFWAARLMVAVLAPWQKKGAKELDPRDLIPDWWGAKEIAKPKSVSDWKAMFKGFAVSKGGTVNGSKRREPGNHHQRQRPAADGGAGEREEPSQPIPEQSQSDSGR